MTKTWKADRYLYLTADGSRVVEEGDPEGKSQYCNPGLEVPLAEAMHLGAIEEPKSEPKKSEPKSESKSTRPSGDKMAEKPLDK